MTEGTQPRPAERTATRRWISGNETWWLGLLLLLGTVAAYLPVWHAGLIWDDRSFVTENPLIRQADGLWRIWFSTKPVDYFPVTSTMWWLEWRLWGSNPTGYHAVNVLLHALGAGLLWRLLARLQYPGAWLAAALFAVHPVNVESVAWVAERKNVLAMAFYLLSLTCFVRSRALVWSSDGAARLSSSPPPPPPPLPPSSSWSWYGLALVAFVLALLSKTVVAPMPFVLLGMLWFHQGKLKRADLLQVLPFMFVAAIIGSVALWFQAHRAIGADIVRTDGFLGRLAGAGWAIWFYASKALFPVGLRSLYPRWQIDARQWWSYLPALLAAVLFLACWHRRRRASWGKGPLWAWFYFVVMLSPVLGFLDIGFMKFSLVADHWQYLAIIGPVVLVAAGIARAARTLRGYSRHALTAAVAVLLVGLGAMTWRRTELYCDSGTFWLEVLASDPSSWAAHNNLGGYLIEQGQLDQAVAHFKRAVEIRPDYAKAQYNLGAALREQGHMDQAILHLQEAVDLQPDYLEAHNRLARALASRGDWDAAREHLQKSLVIDPDQAEAHNNLGNVLRQKGQFAEAAAAYARALALHPDYAAAAFNLGDVLRSAGDTTGAVAHYTNALEIDPDFAPALDRLAWVLSTSPDASLRDGPRAVRLATRAERNSGGKNPGVTGTLAAAYAEVGRFPEAVAAAESALRLAVAQGRADRADLLRKQLTFYQAGAPYREPTGPADGH